MDCNLTEEDEKADELGAYIYKITRTENLSKASNGKKLPSTMNRLRRRSPRTLSIVPHIPREELHGRKRKASLPAEKQNESSHIDEQVPHGNNKKSIDMADVTELKQKRNRNKLCSITGCTSNAKIGGICCKHGAKTKRCSHNGCTNQVVKGGVCRRHGAKTKRCRCSITGCTSNAKVGGVCCKHGAKVKRCSHNGCTNQAQSRGVCIRHGAKVKSCSQDGCTNGALRGGVCWRHGASR